MRKFKASVAVATDIMELDLFCIVLAELPDNSGARLEIQRALRFDEHDRRAGHYIYCICVEAGATHYGGITSWGIENGELTIRLTKEAASALDIANGFRVTLPLDRCDSIGKGLVRVLTHPDAAS
jgi:hypothetical protein